MAFRPRPSRVKGSLGMVLVGRPSVARRLESTLGPLHGRNACVLRHERVGPSGLCRNVRVARYPVVDSRAARRNSKQPWGGRRAAGECQMVSNSALGCETQCRARLSTGSPVYRGTCRFGWIASSLDFGWRFESGVELECQCQCDQNLGDFKLDRIGFHPSVQHAFHQSDLRGLRQLAQFDFVPKRARGRMESRA